MPVFVVVIIVSVIIFLYMSSQNKSGGGNWVQFYARGRDAGFSLKDTELLRELAVKCDLEDPSDLFWSQSLFDSSLRFLLRKIKASGEFENQETQDFLTRLFDYRKNIELNKPKTTNIIANSREIGEGQKLKVLLPGSGVYKSRIIKNTNHYLTISRPINSRKSTSGAWEGAKISVYFWREYDAGYVFDAVVQDEILSKGMLALKISHGESLFRTQKRKSVRAKFQKPAYLYLIHEGISPYKLEQYPGLKCFFDDLSDTGCSVIIGGETGSGQKVKVQFALDNVPVCMAGTVRSTSYDEATGRSKLHIEADDLPIETRNRILAEVLGMQPDYDEDELPPRIQDDEAASIDMQDAPADEPDNAPEYSGEGGGGGEVEGSVDIEKISRDFDIE